MQDRALIATRKGLFELIRNNGKWDLGPSSFLGDPVTMTLHDRRDGALYAALNLGHFGVKLHRRDKGAGTWRSTDAGAWWQQIAQQTQGLISDFGFAVAVHPQDPDTAWFVSAVADQKRVPVDAALSVTRTRDGGRSFEALRTGLPQQHCYDLIYRHGLAVTDDGQTLVMGSTTGGLWISDNGGDAWQAISTTLPPIYAVRFF